jgi:hypothetical protein
MDKKEPRILVFDVETNAIESNPEGVRVHVTVAVARWVRELGSGVTCVVPSAQEDGELHARFAPLLDEADAIVAYNGRGFDLRVLRRAHFVGQEERVARWAAKLIDPFEVMRATTGSWVKLDELLEANGLPSKTGSGLDAIKWWADGERDKVARYCEADVDALRNLLELPEETPLRFPVKRWVERKQVVTGWAQLDWQGYVRRWWAARMAPQGDEEPRPKRARIYGGQS